MTRALLALVLAGCFSTPRFDARDAGAGSDADIDASICTYPTASTPSAEGMQLEFAASRWTVSAPGSFSMAFADDSAFYPFPMSLLVGGVEMLETSAGGCSVEDNTGIAIYPSYSVAGRQVPTADPHALERQVVGPAYIQVRANWRYDHPGAGCSTLGPNNVGLEGAGHSTFNFYANGRVVRRDSITPSVHTVFIPSECSCSGGSETSFLVTSYTSFAATGASYTRFDAQNVEGTSTLPGANAQNDPGFGGCLTSGNARVAVRFGEAQEPESRLRRSATKLIFVHDIDTASTSIARDQTFVGRTQYLMSNGAPSNACIDMNSDLQSLGSPPMLQIGGVDRPVELDGFYDDTAESHDSAFSVVAASGRIGDGFSIRVRMPGATGVRTNAMGDVWWQRDGDEFYIVFERGLQTGDSYTVMPACES